jgi:hypothetical protein
MKQARSGDDKWNLSYNSSFEDKPPRSHKPSGNSARFLGKPRCFPELAVRRPNAHA